MKTQGFSEYAYSWPILLLQPRYAKGISWRARGRSQYGTAAAVAAIRFGDAAQEETEKQRDIIKSYEYGFAGNEPFTTRGKH